MSGYSQILSLQQTSQMKRATNLKQDKTDLEHTLKKKIKRLSDEYLHYMNIINPSTYLGKISGISNNKTCITDISGALEKRFIVGQITHFQKAFDKQILSSCHMDDPTKTHQFNQDDKIEKDDFVCYNETSKPWKVMKITQTTITIQKTTNNGTMTHVINPDTLRKIIVKVGEKVKFRLTTNGKWIDGKVTNINSDNGMFTITTEQDGKSVTHTNIERDNVRASFKVNDLVKYIAEQSKPKWISAKVTHKHQDGTFTVQIEEDNTEVQHVSRNDIQFKITGLFNRKDILEKYYYALQALYKQYFEELQKLESPTPHYRQDQKGSLIVQKHNKLVQQKKVKAHQFFKAVRILVCKYGMTMSDIKTLVKTLKIFIPNIEDFDIKYSGQILNAYKDTFNSDFHHSLSSNDSSIPVDDETVRQIFLNPDKEYKELEDALSIIDNLRQKDRDVLVYCPQIGPQTHRRKSAIHQQTILAPQTLTNNGLRVKSKNKEDMSSFFQQYSQSLLSLYKGFPVSIDDATFIKFRPLYERLKELQKESATHQQQFTRCLQKIASFYHLLRCMARSYDVFKDIVGQHSVIIDTNGMTMKFKKLEKDTVQLSLILPSRQEFDIHIQNTKDDCNITFFLISRKQQSTSTSTSSQQQSTSTSTPTQQSEKKQLLDMNEFYKYMCYLGKIIKKDDDIIHQDEWTPFWEQVQKSPLLKKYPVLRKITKDEKFKPVRKMSNFDDKQISKLVTYSPFYPFGRHQESEQQASKRTLNAQITQYNIRESQLIQKLKFLTPSQLSQQQQQHQKGKCGTPNICSNSIQSRIQTLFSYKTPDIDVVDILSDMKLWWMIRFFVPPLYMESINKYLSVDDDGWITMMIPNKSKQSKNTSFSVLFSKTSTDILDKQNQYKVNGEVDKSINEFKKAVLESIDQWLNLPSASKIFIQYMKHIIELYKKLVEKREQRKGWYFYFTGQHANQYTSVDTFKTQIKTKTDDFIKKINTSSASDVCKSLRSIEQYFYDSVETLFKGASFTTTPTKQSQPPAQPSHSQQLSKPLLSSPTNNEAKKIAYFKKNFGPFVLEQSGKGQDNLDKIFDSFKSFIDVVGSKKPIPLKTTYSS